MAGKAKRARKATRAKTTNRMATHENTGSQRNKRHTRNTKAKWRTEKRGKKTGTTTQEIRGKKKQLRRTKHAAAVLGNETRKQRGTERKHAQTHTRKEKGPSGRIAPQKGARAATPRGTVRQGNESKGQKTKTATMEAGAPHTLRHTRKKIGKHTGPQRNDRHKGAAEHNKKSHNTTPHRTKRQKKHKANKAQQNEEEKKPTCAASQHTDDTRRQGEKRRDRLREKACKHRRTHLAARRRHK
ncbi:hypothetical protein, conserved in T. vivax [Trypanosoma vivax Y486]|uniref:Uncharacterized protein n=1 Tax=Trypanosoma vivax (strain Y486) TaxID=1055687 RepID=F9WTC3_TRYVY|nr:hypothetical protein, conserved in T. vivax [Trypanosoma vivax Y486]|eukprot:CCD20816.1 hypothetical protein, conserved in T. vivax [Trypanosoma vivax Y486]